MNSINRSNIIAQLQTDILRLEGFKPADLSGVNKALGPLNESFPDGVFPLGAIHEFFGAAQGDNPSSTGFMAGLLASIMGTSGTALWISSSRRLFPPSLMTYRLQPDRFIFIDLHRERDIIWAMEEALKCAALTTVVAEVGDISFTASRRLQLAVERSKVTGLILRHDLQKASTTACISRWKIASLPSQPMQDLPGIGLPKWRVELVKIRNGKPGVWDVVWHEGKFIRATSEADEQSLYEGRQKAG